MNGNGIGKHGCVEIANALHFNDSLTGLDLGANQVGNSGVHASLPAPYDSPFFLHCDSQETRPSFPSEGNFLGWAIFLHPHHFQGVMALAAALATNTAVVSLDIHDNDVHLQGVGWVSFAL